MLTVCVQIFNKEYSAVCSHFSWWGYGPHFFFCFEDTFPYPLPVLNPYWSTLVNSILRLDESELLPMTRPVDTLTKGPCPFLYPLPFFIMQIIAPVISAPWVQLQALANRHRTLRSVQVKDKNPIKMYMTRLDHYLLAIKLSEQSLSFCNNFQYWTAEIRN